MPDNLSRKIAQLSEEEDNEELDKTLIRTQKEFDIGAKDSRNYDSSPEDVLKDYQDFN